MKKQIQRRLSMVLAVLLSFTLMPALVTTVYAAELTPTVPGRNADGAIYYSFDEDFGGAIPIGTNHTGFGTNTQDTNPGTASLVESEHGKALKLDGTSGMYLGQGLITGNSYTIAFWIKPDGPLATTFSPVFFGARGGTNANRWISVHANTGRIPEGGFGMDVRYETPGTGNLERPYNFADSPLTADEWQHVAVSNNNGSVTLYVNGIPQAKAASNTIPTAYGTNGRDGSLLNDTAKFYLGVTHNAQDAPFPMEIDELYIYDSALNALDVTRMLNPEFELPTGLADTPVAPEKTADGAYYWSFDEDFGGAANVAVGEGLKGVNTEIEGTVKLEESGKKGGAASFDYFGGLYLGDNLITTDKYTVAFWASPKSATDLTSMFFGGNQNEYLNFTTKISASGGVRARKGGVDRDVAVSGAASGWTHYALVVNGSSAEIWVNGFLTATSGSFHNNMFGDITDAKYFLGVNFSSEAYIGLIDELYVYDGKALARGEIMEMADVYAADRGQFITPGANAGYVDPPAPSFSNVSVHDPSIVRDGDGYYIVGTHLASARSNDLMSWTQVYGDGVNSSKDIYPKTGSNSITPIEAQIAKVLVSGSIGMWALDVIQLKDGRYYQYYSLNGNGPTLSPSSGIGVAVSDNIDGPFETIDMFIMTGAANGGKAMYGGADYNAGGVHPNCIDPAPFYDKNGKLWMVYGSWSGGIFILEMDEDTGLPIPYEQSAINRENDGYGRMLVASYHQGMEGPYIIYSPDSDYYYLFLSFGGLEADGGYNIRVFRSRNPDGPYEDDRHTRLTQWDGNPSAGAAGYIDADGTTFYHNDRGVKIMGGYRFIGTDFEDALLGTGYLSPGHNSAYYDPATGQYFLVYHQRFMTGSGSGHQVRVAEMFVNEDGWLVAAPFRYDGGSVRSFSMTELVGSYKILHHGRDTNTTSRLATTAYNLMADGSVVNVTGVPAGSWKLSGDNKAEITIDGVTCKGVFLRQYNTDQSVWSQAFTALSEDGMAIWGVGVTGAAAATDFCAVSVTTPTIVATLAANLAISVEDGSGKALIAYLRVGDELLYGTALTDGKGTMRVTAAPEAGNYKLVVLGEGCEGSCDIKVVPYNTDIWYPTVRVEEGRLLVMFNDDITLKSASGCVTIGSGNYNARVLDDKRTIEVLGIDASTLAGGTAVSVKGVKYPVLFPSYSFTFTVTVP